MSSKKIRYCVYKDIDTWVYLSVYKHHILKFDQNWGKAHNFHTNAVSVVTRQEVLVFGDRFRVKVALIIVFSPWVAPQLQSVNSLQFAPLLDSSTINIYVFF